MCLQTSVSMVNMHYLGALRGASDGDEQIEHKVTKNRQSGQLLCSLFTLGTPIAVNQSWCS